MDKQTYAVLKKKIDNVTENIDEVATQATEAWLEDNIDPSTGYVLDNTLTLDNAAPPASAVGDLKSALFSSSNDADLWAQGYWGTTDGSAHSANDWIRSKSHLFIDSDTIFNNANLLMYLQAWSKEGNTYIGTWDGTAFTKTYVASSGVTTIDFSYFKKQYPLYNFALSIKAASGGNISPSVDGAKVYFGYNAITSIENDVFDLRVSGEVKFKSSDLYEHGEVSIDKNMYDNYPAGSPINRARIKKEYIQEIPADATTVEYYIPKEAFANGKYKIGWAQYTENYVQISATVAGWFTAPVRRIQSINENAKYFMFYIATVSNNDSVDLSTLPLNGYSVTFDSSDVNYGEQISNKTLVTLYPEIEKRISNIEQADDLLQKNYFFYSINHRGYNTIAPENTIPAFVLSRKKGFSYVECDVLFTSDNIPVILHDTTINRTARNADGTTLSSTINIADITYEQALSYDFGIYKGEQWAGTKIPTFEEFIIACKKLSLHPFIELKDSVNGTYWTDSRIASVANIVKECGMGNNVAFMSFALQAVQKISVHFPKARIGLGFEGSYTQENFSNFISNAESLVSDNHDVFVTVNYSSMTTELYSMLTDADLNPVAWTVNSKDAVLNLDKSVIGVLSDWINAGEVYLDQMLETLE